MHTGSMINLLMGNHQSALPEMGTGATVLGWTDRHAATVIAVSKNGMQITVQQDTATRTDDNGMSESQSYSYEPNPNGFKSRYSLRSNGQWVRVGSSTKNGARLCLGIRREYHDYSF
jgi:hypothetical protein